jgi:hypothetical protein
MYFVGAQRLNLNFNDIRFNGARGNRIWCQEINVGGEDGSIDVKKECERLRKENAFLKNLVSCSLYSLDKIHEELFGIPSRINFVGRIPDELSLLIFGFLDIEHRLKCREVCKKWQPFAQDDCLWIDTHPVEVRQYRSERVYNKGIIPRGLEGFMLNKLLEEKNKKYGH